VLHAEAWAKQFISSVHHSLHDIFGKFHSTENVSKCSRQPCCYVTRFDTVAPVHFKRLSKLELSAQHPAFAAPLKADSDPMNANTFASNPKYGAFSQRKILSWWLSLWVFSPTTLVLGKTFYYETSLATVVSKMLSETLKIIYMIYTTKKCNKC